MSALDQVKSRSLRLLDYLAALATDLRGAPRRRLAEYDPAPVVPRDVPEHPAVRLGPGQTRESWLEVGKVAAPVPPRVPPVLYPYIGSVEVGPDAPPPLPADLRERAASRDEDPGAVALAHDRWVRESWQPWAPAARAAHAARKLYERLFDLRLRHTNDTTGLQLVWGHSVLSWRTGAAGGEPAVVEHPLLITPVRFEVDQDSGLIRVLADGPTSVETDPVRGLESPELRDLPGLRDRLRTIPPDVWDPVELAELHGQIAAPLGLDSAVLPGPDLPAPGPDARVVDTWALFLRPRPATGARFYNELREAMAELDFLPEAVAAVVAPESLVTEALGEALDAGGGSPDPITGAEDDGWATTGARLLMPLPTNDDQERVATQLATSRGVTVQGPPGTGKSHTIANLVCHLVAHGRRVLVTAQDEQALAVLQEKIPDELRHLSVAVLGSSQADIEELRACVVEIQAAVADVDVAAETRQVSRLAAELDAVRSRTRALELDLVELLRGEEREFDLPHGRARAAEVSAWLAENEAALGFVPDRLNPGVAPPVRAEELGELFTLARQIPPGEAAAAGRNLPDPAALPGAARLSSLFDRLAELGSGVAEAERAGLSPDAVDRLGAAGLAELRAETLAGAEALQAVEAPWLVNLRDQCASSPRLADFWREQAAQLSAAVTELHALQRQAFGHTAQVPPGDPRDQLRLLTDLRERLATGRGLPRFGGRELREFAERLLVDGYPPRAVADLDVAAAVVNGRLRAHAALARHTDIAGQLGAPRLGGSGSGPGGGDSGVFASLRALDAASEEMAAAIAWETRSRPALAGRLRPVFPALPARPTSVDLRRCADLLGLAGSRIDQRLAEGEIAQLAEHLLAHSAASDAGVPWSDLADALDRRDLAGWADALAESARLRSLRPAVRRRAELAARLAAAAPLWADRVLADLGDPATCGEPDRLVAMWRWRQAESWLEDLHSGGDVPALQRRLDESTEAGRRLVLDVARRSARLALARNLGSEQRQALTGWVQALSRVGKGTGKFAARWRAEARGHMTAAMGAVPVWIMPIHRVMESFDPRVNDPFDVVIVDESSQCDVLSLGVLSLGRKAVVVGDDQQTSPSAVGIPRDRVFALIEDHLPDVAHRSLLDVEASLYDTAARVFPRTVVLKEHFRCLPEIIGFSNRFYDHQILPLRETPEFTVGPALRPVRVAGGGRAPGRFGDANDVEAAAVVDQIVECCADPAYDGMTFGVVTLLGAGQPRLIEHSLVEKLGEEEYVRRRIRVGDPYQFQGDERDVIFISVVADDNRSAATRRRDMQRVNVAASRARDQLWVFHTVAPETLRDDDARRQLIDYMYATRAPEEVSRLADRCESEFERAVLREILARGYRVHPQHPVGRYRIDLVIEGDDARLAVECDGDRYHGPDQWEADLRRQRILERLDWTFWRIRGSEFYRHPARTLDALWRRLDQMGIHPAPPGPPTAGRAPGTATGPVPGAAGPTRPSAAPGPRGTPTAPTVPTARIAPDTHPTSGPGQPPPGLSSRSPGVSGDPGPDESTAHLGVPLQRGEPPSESVGPASGDTPAAGSTTGPPEPRLAEPDATTPPDATPPDATTPDATATSDMATSDMATRVTGPRGTETSETETTGAETGHGVPDGYRHVGWVRPEEAEAVLAALALARDIPIAATGGRARVVATDPCDRLPVHPAGAAQGSDGGAEPRPTAALLLRPRPSPGAGGRRITWLTEAEAQAVLRAAAAGRDQSIARPPGSERGLVGIGLVQYFPDESEPARRHGSVTRVLRAVWAGERL